MRLTRIALEGVGRFGKPVAIEGIAPGLNVLAAPNEAGKSTLFRAVRTCIFESHTANKEAVRALASDAGSIPVTIEVGFEHGGQTYLVQKSFLSSVRAALFQGGQKIAEGKAADEKIHEVLGLKAGSGKNVDTGAFGLLWVEQSGSFEPPNLTGAAKDSLEDAIEREVGLLVGGDRARDALKTLEAELQTLFTKTGVSKNGPLGMAETRARDLAVKLAEDEKLLDDLERDIGELERKRRERAQHADPKVEADLRARLAACVKEQEDAGRLAAELRNLETAEKLARAGFDERTRLFAQLNACARRIDETSELLAGARKALAPLAQDESACMAALQQARDGLGALEEQDARDAQGEAHLRLLAQAAAAAAGKPALSSRLAELERIGQEMSAARAARARIKADAKDVEAIARMEREIALLTDRLNARAPRLEITPAAQALAPMVVQGESVRASRTFSVTGRTLVSIAGVGDICVTPPPGFGEEEREELAALQGRRTKQLALAGAADLAELRDCIERARDLDQTLTGLRTQLAALGCSDATLAADIGIVRTKIDAANAAIADVLGAEAPPPLAQIEGKQTALQAKRAACATSRKRLQAEIDARNDSLRALTKTHAEQRMAADELARTLERDTQTLPPGERAARLAEAGAALNDARRAHESALASLEALKASAPDEARLADIGLRVKRYEGALANHREGLRKLDEQVSSLEGAIGVRGGEGVGERVQALRDELALAQRDCERLRGRAQALTLLRDTIRGCYEEQRELLQTPLRRHLQPFLNDLFARAELTLDETFHVARLMRDGSPEAFQRLSDGTKEQIAVLVRLAMGGLLLERGEDVPIILDDALVFCDDDRIERMFDALNRAAQRQQVIMLTCRTKSFNSLGGKALAIEPLARSLR
ncbi:MAG: hypothetical protein JWN93_3482 [Hyphomicrobiales bacterium]|nr:hypothetical protein [Hyphomicrobiales bacterium]